MIGGTQRMLVYDDTEPSEKLRLYDSGVTVQNQPKLEPEKAYNLLVQYRTGDVLAPRLDGTEALKRVVETFAHAIHTGTPPVTDGQAGLRVVQLLEAAQESLRRESAKIKL
jgi:predicted dehydrogenase